MPSSVPRERNGDTLVNTIAVPVGNQTIPFDEDQFQGLADPPLAWLALWDAAMAWKHDPERQALAEGSQMRRLIIERLYERLLTHRHRDFHVTSDRAATPLKIIALEARNAEIDVITQLASQES